MPDNVAPSVELDSQIGWCAGPDGRARTDQPKVVEERAVKSRVEEAISQRVLLRQAANGQISGVVVAHRQAAVLAPGHESIHTAAVDLALLLIGPIHDVPCLMVWRNILARVIWSDR